MITNLIRIPRTIEWQIAMDMLRGRRAKRSGKPYFNHVKEGVQILQILGAPLITQQAFCLHPLVQADADLAKNYCLLRRCDPLAVALAMEYRWVANNGTRKSGIPLALSVLPEVNQMLVADKIQNRKDFLETFNRADPEFSAIDCYFKEWLGLLAITENQYEWIVEKLRS